MDALQGAAQSIRKYKPKMAICTYHKLQDIWEIPLYIKKLRPQITTINPLTPFPGLPMYEQYRDRLLFKKEDYEKWSFGQLIIRPSNMSIRRYYYELMITYLYVNLFINGNTDMLRKYGASNMLRIGVGALKASRNYIRLMFKG